MDFYQNKIIWITGASSGIGAGIAKLLADKGANLILSARNLNSLEEVKNQCKNSQNIKLLPLDLNDIDSFEAIAKEALTLFGEVDMLINNAGISQRSLIMDTSMRVYKQLMDINYLGTIGLTKSILPHFIEKKRGTFVVVSSLMGKFSSPYRSGYCGAKHALHGFFDALRMEHEKDGINVTIICPGFVQTQVAVNALIGDGSPQGTNDDATLNGMSVDEFGLQMIKAVQKGVFEAYIAGSEKKGIWVKRFFPRLLHQLVLRSQVK